MPPPVPRPWLGRAAPRSRLGCVMCKQRHVRCDQTHPVCNNCTRLGLECMYRPRARARKEDQNRRAVEDSSRTQAQAREAREQQQPPSNAATSNGTHAAQGYPANEFHTQEQMSQDPQGLLLHNQTYCANRPAEFNNLTWLDDKQNSLTNAIPDFDTSFVGQPWNFFTEAGDLFSPGPLRPLRSLNGVHDFTPGPLADPTWITVNPATTSLSCTNRNGIPDNPPHTSLPNRSDQISTSPTLPVQTQRLGINEVTSANQQERDLMSLFSKIVQPPAAILIGGVRKWRRLQRYLIELSDQSKAVLCALLTVIELLSIEEISKWPGQDQQCCISRILERHKCACAHIETTLLEQPDLKQSLREELLAAIFLLAWFEVMHDQSENESLFPRQLADAILITNTSSIDWSEYAMQLLSWFNTLDSKATHVGGEPLLSTDALRIVSRYRTQIVSSNNEDCEDIHDHKFATDGKSPGFDWSARSPHCSEENASSTVILTGGYMKQVVLHAVVQPALEWYLTSQSFCRRIGSQDKHHRQRFTPDDEYEVIVASRAVEKELWELWNRRPTVISFTAEELQKIMSLDMAIRLEEVFSIYLASFWILLVYLHRVSWWNLPLSPTSRAALVQVWQNMQRAYGEIVNDEKRKKVVHPALLWPLFLFGCECPDPEQQKWAIEQLEGLGESKPVLEVEDRNEDTLPNFRMSSGATRNAKRAALLLRELTKKQTEVKARVDDRDLSIQMFGCYFAII